MWIRNVPETPPGHCRTYNLIFSWWPADLWEPGRECQSYPNRFSPGTCFTAPGRNAVDPRQSIAITAVERSADGRDTEVFRKEVGIKLVLLTRRLQASGDSHEAGRRIVQKIFAGGHVITLSHPGVPDVTLAYTTFDEITDDIDDARVYGGIHFRFDQKAGARQGRQVASYVYKHYLRPVHAAR